MNCSNCGSEIKTGDKFCRVCGTAVEKEEISKETNSLREGPDNGGKKSKVLKIVLPVILVAIVIGGIFVSKIIADNREFKELYTTAKSYMEDYDYDKALEYLRKAEKIKSNDADVKKSIDEIVNSIFNECRTTVMNNIESGYYQEALDSLNDCPITSNDSCYEEYKNLKKIVAMKPNIESIDSSEFPNVKVTIAYEGDMKLDENSFSLSEAGKDREIKSIETINNKVIVNYEAKDFDYDSQTFEVAVRIKIEDVSLFAVDSYDTPSFQRANLQLMSTDVSDYPRIKAYFRVENSDTYESISKLGIDNFTVEEYIEGGTYLSREVHNVSQLNGHSGLNISLVADKSDSISFSDMDKIKRVMTEFVNKLNYKEGDKAEVLAFDSIVQQMCGFTDNSTLLVNGINNMSTDGLTAFYDAVYYGINHATLEGGAR